MHFETDSIIYDIETMLRSSLGSQDSLVPRSHPVSHQINSTLIADFGDTPFFIKLNHASRLEMFESEAVGLAEIAQSKTITVPEPVCTGSGREHSFLVLEHLEFSAETNAAQLGEKLAAMHRHTRNQFGWTRDNTIGLTAQPNPMSTDWVEFWRRQRLGFQLKLAAQNGYSGRLQAEGERLMQSLHNLFSGYQPLPALLHGDLWSGNYGYLKQGEPVIYDPAVYYGDRETDLAMTELFGGFSPEFYSAYQHHYPLDAGYRVRKNLYQLYHVLNHLNLFGRGYLEQALSLTERLNRELG